MTTATNTQHSLLLHHLALISSMHRSTGMGTICSATRSLMRSRRRSWRMSSAMCGRHHALARLRQRRADIRHLTEKHSRAFLICGTGTPSTFTILSTTRRIFDHLLALQEFGGLHPDCVFPFGWLLLKFWVFSPAVSPSSFMSGNCPCLLHDLLHWPVGYHLLGKCP